MESLLEWLEETSIAVWVSSSEWGYGSTLAVHGIGMAIVVGLTAVIALRILGFPAGLSMAGLRSLVPYMLFGLTINTLTGIALFMAAATDFFYNIAFQIKIGMIILGIFLILKLDKYVLKPAEISANDDFVPSQRAKKIAIGAILIWWFSVVLSGRLIGYVIYM